MPKALKILLGSLALCISSAGLAADAESVLADARAHHESFKSKIRDRTMTAEATIQWPGAQSHEVQMKMWEKGDKTREEVETKMPGGAPEGMPSSVTMIEIDDGTDRWRITAMQGKQKVTGEAKDRPEFEYWLEPPEGARVTGSETMDGRDCWVIENEQTAKYEFSRTWLDKEYYVLLRAEGTDSDGKPQYFENSDFREILDGYKVPFVTDFYMDGVRVMQMRMTDVKVNQGVSDELFDVDKVEPPAGPNLQEMMKQMMQGTDEDE